MTDIVPPAGRAPPWILRPAVALPFIGVAVLIISLLTPESVSGRSGDARLTSLSTSALGASALFELSARLGWRAERRFDPEPLATDTTAIQAVLSPALPLGAGEAHALLETVRRGGSLLLVFESGTPLADSLGLRAWLLPGVFDASALTGDVSNGRQCPAQDRFAGLPLWPDGQVHLLPVRFARSRAIDASFGKVRFGAGRSPGEGDLAAVGFSLGRGRVVAMADPDLLRNDVLRLCAWGADVAAIRMLEYLTPTSVAPHRLVFDEYHQGFGNHPGTTRGILLYLGHTASGHVLGQALLGGVVLLLAIGPRMLPPRRDVRALRRSPIEHVEALGRAYQQVGATRTATSRLLHGLRRRYERRGARAPDDDALGFLDTFARSAKAPPADIQLIRSGLDSSLSPRQFEALGRALVRLESSPNAGKWH